MHRDLKSPNIFLDQGDNVKLGDFGVAKRLVSDDVTWTVIFTVHPSKKLKCFVHWQCVGTKWFMSPEVISEQPYSFSSDVWGLGVILYELCMLRLPFEASVSHFDEKFLQK